MKAQAHRQAAFPEDGQVYFPPDIPFDRGVAQREDQDGVADEDRQGANSDPFIGFEPKGDERSQCIGDTDPLKYAESPYLESFQVVKGVHFQQFPNDKNKDAPFDDLYDRIFGQVLAEFTHGEPDGSTYDKKESGKNQIGRRAAVPYVVFQGGVHMPPAAGIVDHDHARYGEPAQDVQA